jgi:hypothetical protein
MATEARNQLLNFPAFAQGSEAITKAAVKPGTASTTAKRIGSMSSLKTNSLNSFLRGQNDSLGKACSMRGESARSWQECNRSSISASSEEKNRKNRSFGTLPVSRMLALIAAGSMAHIVNVAP